MAESYAPITPEIFIKKLGEYVECASSELLTIPGITAILSEHFKEDILTEYEDEHEHLMTDEDCLLSFLDTYDDTDNSLASYRIDRLKAEYNDDIMLREDYNNFTDGLCKDGQISLYLYENMDNPF